MSARKLKVFAVNAFCPTGPKRGLQRCIVACSSQKEAAELFDVSLHYLRGYGSETGNSEEVSAALNSPRTVIPSPSI